MTDETMVWTQGMDEWAPLSTCKRRFGLDAMDEMDEEIDNLQLIDELDFDETVACLGDFGIKVDGEYPLETLKSVLRRYIFVCCL
eukprot:SAG31_NODE_399_length_16247_cov_19.137540_12_plen_85_part_00